MPSTKKKPEHKEKREPARLERWTENVTRWVGSRQSVVVHTVFFTGMLMLSLVGVKTDTVLLVLTTIVSLEAIYMSIFIQMTVNKNTYDIEEIQEDVEEIQEDVEEIQEDVEEIQEDVEGIEKDVDEIQEDVDEIQKDVDEIQEDVDEIQKDVDEIQEDVDEIEKEEETPKQKHDRELLTKIEGTLGILIKEIEQLKKK